MLLGKITVFGCLFASAMLASGCAHRRATPGAPEAAEAREVELRNTSFVMSTCPDSPKMDSRAANAAMRKLVEPCAKAPGQAARFQATLVPGGRIEIASATGDRVEGVVPVCILQNKLVHSVLLKDRCIFDVQLEERTMSAPQGPKDKP